MTRTLYAVLAAVVLGTVALIALDGRKTLYVGGTIPGIGEKTEGMLSTSSEQELVFTPDRGTAIRIPYRAITTLEYGQKEGQRSGVGGLVSRLNLFSKKRNYLTIAFKDASGRDAAGVFELGKDVLQTTLMVLEIRSGRQIEYQSEDARRSVGP